MTEYELNVKIPNAARNIQYKEHLTGSYESYPEDFFRIEANRNKVRQYIETESERTVSKQHLDRIIQEWVDDIKSGYSPTTVTLDLPPKTPSAVSQKPYIQNPSMRSQETFVQSLGNPTPKQPNKGNKAKAPKNKSDKQQQINLNKNNEQTQSQKNPSPNQNSDGKKPSKQPEEIKSKIWSDETNVADF